MDGDVNWEIGLDLRSVGSFRVLGICALGFRDLAG